jgi:hypothetical protein
VRLGWMNRKQADYFELVCLLRLARTAREPPEFTM